MLRFGSFFLASMYSLMLKILELIYKSVCRSKSSLAEENGSNFSENRSRLDDEVFSNKSNVVLAVGVDGKVISDSHSKGNDFNATAESSVLLQNRLVSKSSKCQVLCGENVSRFLEEPTSHKFVVQELFVGTDYVVASGDSETRDNNGGLFNKNLEDHDRKEFDEESPFYFKLLNASFSTNEETVENESEMESAGRRGKAEVDDQKGDKQGFSDEDFAYEIEFNRKSVSEMESIVIDLCGEEQVDEKEDFAYEVELIQSSRLAVDQESDCLEQIVKNDCENWMSSFLDETDHTKSYDADDSSEEVEELLDDEYIELEMDSEIASSSCADANANQTTSQESSRVEGQSCWDSDSDVEEDEPDVLSEHQHLVQQMKMELKNCRIRGLPTISEESETSKIVEDLKPLQIDHKIGYKDVVEGIQKFYKSYTERMRKLDILNYQTSHAISFLQLKESEVYRAGKKKGGDSSSTSVLPKIWQGKTRRRIYADPMQKSMSEMQRDLEVVYVGQMCLSWEILCWLDARARELLEYDGEGKHSYNRAAEEFQQFQVLVQRFMEDEQFQGRSRSDNYVRSRCMIRSLLQVPTIKDDCLKTKKERREETDAISLEMLVETIKESMLIFQEFVFADKKATNAAVLTNVQESGTSEILLDVVSSLHKKNRRMREQIMSKNCIVQRLKKHQERRSEREIMTAQVELRLVWRVLNMSRLSRDQLDWCKNKLNNISFVGRKLIHGLVDRIMEVNGTPFVSPGDNTGYYIESSNEPEYLAGRQARIVYKGETIGAFGIVHPQVLRNFDIPDPCSFVEIDIEKFL